ncbi:MAG: hypothetical protein H6738_18140 [Alphaproteobacteria bacterium]|nr:hypothetical protein [Alphaproteobacteria bacterium]
MTRLAGDHRTGGVMFNAAALHPHAPFVFGREEQMFVYSTLRMAYSSPGAPFVFSVAVVVLAFIVSPWYRPRVAVGFTALLMGAWLMIGQVVALGYIDGRVVAGYFPVRIVDETVPLAGPESTITSIRPVGLTSIAFSSSSGGGRPVGLLREQVIEDLWVGSVR